MLLAIWECSVIYAVYKRIQHHLVLHVSMVGRLLLDCVYIYCTSNVWIMQAKVQMNL